MQQMLKDIGVEGRDFEKTKAFPSMLNHDYTDSNLDQGTAELKELAEELLRLGHSQRFSTFRVS